MSLHATDQSENSPGKDDPKPDSKSDKENCQPKADEKNRSSSKKESSKGDKKSYPGRSQKPPRFEKAGLGSKRKSEYEKESRNRGDEKPAKLPRQGSKQEKVTAMCILSFIPDFSSDNAHLTCPTHDCMTEFFFLAPG